ncbi:hypothetical protein HanRHA438_Chr14g0659731 [Helianthus annuus]|nr:hypothetical protein HanRHA438_Chr14g0659731 [Helianthus annuus]
MISIGVLLGYWVSEDSHSCWYLVALQACWIRSGVVVVVVGWVRMRREMKKMEMMVIVMMSR